MKFAHPDQFPPNSPMIPFSLATLLNGSVATETTTVPRSSRRVARPALPINLATCPRSTDEHGITPPLISDRSSAKD
ncbi:hypothetical protein D3C86_1950630 [compost metagenome]